MYQPDFENPMDANRDNVYEVTVTVRGQAGAMGTRNVQCDGYERGRGG